MTLAEISIRRPVFAWMLMGSLILFGAICFSRMGISQLPDVDFPVLTVSLSYEGAAPEVIESDIVDVVEDAVMTVQGIRQVSSYSRYGTGTITIEFELNRDIDSALQEVQTKIAQAQKRLPREMDPPTITKTNPEDQPILWLTLTSDKHKTLELMRYVRDQLKDKFSTVKGVGEVFLGGYIEPNLRVWVSNKSLNRYELTIGDILSTINNEHAEVPAGQIETNRREYDVRTLGEAKSVEEFSTIVVNERGGRPNFAPILLNQVAKVEEGLSEIRRLSRFNGKTAVGLGIKKQRGSNAVEVARAAKKKLTELKSTLPEGMGLGINFDTTKFIEDSVGELNFTLLLSALMTGLVCWLFLGSWSSTVNILLAIPTSIIGAFIALYFAGFTLNTFTLLGLSLAIGIVVDDAIMVLENIVRHRESGKTRLAAALDGSREITFAAIAATVAVVAIFLPVVFMRGAIGRFFFQFGITMTTAVVLSLLEALTLTPMRCAAFVERGRRTTWLGRSIDGALSGAINLYRGGLTVALRHRWKVVVFALIFFAISTASIKFINKEFVPAQDQSAFLLRVQAPVDSSIAFTDSKFKEIERFLSNLSEVERFFVAVGGFGGGEVNSGIVFVTMKPKGKRGIDQSVGHERTQQEFMDFCRKQLKNIPDIKVFAQDLSLRGFSASRGFPIEFSVRGADWSKLGDYVREISARMEKSGLVTDIDNDYRLGKPEIQIHPNRTEAARRGVSIRAISETVSAMIGGVVRGKYAMGGHRYDIRVRLMPNERGGDERGNIEQIPLLYVRNNRGELVQLRDVVTIDEKPSLQQIARFDRERAISIFANIKPGKSQALAMAAVEKIAGEVLGSGYHAVFGGSAQTFKESFGDLVFAMILGLVVAYMVLASQFNSFLDPVTILLALPFSLSGAFLALLLAHQSLNIYSFIGLILLMGIVKKNSILLVEFTNQVRAAKGLGIRDALIAACPLRLRPILMTSVTTIAAAIPPALALGPGAETRVPMAIAVIGGVLVSTVLTLFVVPCAYSLFGSLRGAQTKITTAVFGGLLLFVALTAPNSGAASSTTGLTLQSAVMRATQNNPVLREEYAKTDGLSASIGKTRAALFPTISAFSSAVSRKDAANTANPRFDGNAYNQYSLGLKFTQPLFARGTLTAVDIAKNETALQEMATAIAKRDLTASVIEAFYRVLANQKQLESLLNIESLEKEVLKTARHRFSIGRGQRLDVLQIEAKLALLEPKIATSKNNIAVSAADLALTLGERDLSELNVIGELDAIPLERLDAVFLKTAGHFIEYERIKLQEAVVGAQDAVVEGKHWPTLVLAGDWGRSAFVKTDLLDSAGSAWSLALQLNLPLFSGLSSTYERQEQIARRAELDASRSQLENKLMLDKIRSRKNLETASQTIRSTRTALALSTKSLNEAKRSFKLATIDFLQFLAVQESYFEAESSINEAKFKYIQSLINYCTASGLALDKLVDLFSVEKSS